MRFSKAVLSNGLRVVTVPMPSSESATLTIWVKTGRRNEEKKVGGISHFLEHMAFKGSRKRPTAKEISEIVDSIGGEFNAATSKDWTNFYIKSRTANLDIAFDVLADMVLNPLLKEQEIEREKGTIIQEIAMYEDTPTARIGDIFEGLIFEGNPLGWDTIGTLESVKGIGKNDFESYRKRYYYPENMLVTVSGGVTEIPVMNLAGKYFQRFQSKSKYKSKTGMFKQKQTKPQVKLHSKDNEQAHFILGFMGDGRNYEGRFAQAVLSAALGMGMSSRLFIEVRERRGLAYAVRTSIERYQDIGYMGTYIGTDPKKVDEAIKVALDEYYKIADRRLPITNHELRKAKEYLKGHLALALEDTKDVGGFFGEQELFGKEVLTPEDVYRRLDKVALDDIHYEAKRLFNKGGLNLAIIGPFKDEEKFVELLK